MLIDKKYNFKRIKFLDKDFKDLLRETKIFLNFNAAGFLKEFIWVFFFKCSSFFTRSILSRNKKITNNNR